MSKYHEPGDYSRAANSAETPVAELLELAKSPYSFVTIYVLKNPNTPSDILWQFLPRVIEADLDYEKAEAIAHNPNVPDELLFLLLQLLTPLLDHPQKYRYFRLGLSLFDNFKIPISTLQPLYEQRASVKFRWYLAWRSTRIELLEILATDRKERVRKKAQSTLDKLKVVAQTTEVEVSDHL